MAKTARMLPNGFFKDNPLERLSAAIIQHFTLTDLMEGGSFQNLTSEIAQKTISEDRLLRIETERANIEQTTEAAALVEIARKGCDIFNQDFLNAKLLEHAEQTFPLLLRRYRTCALDGFIEIAVRAFYTGDMRYTQLLREMYSEIRSPYAKACACLVFGMKGMKEEIPFLYGEFLRFQAEYPDESFEQHPLLALYILCDQF